MLRLKQNYGKPPLGGWKHKEGDVELEGESFQQLLSAIREYRMNNVKLPGAPEEELLSLYAVSSPWLVEQSAVKAKETPFAVSVLDWLNGTWRSPPAKPLSLADTQPRIDVCMTCPHREPFSKGDIGDECKRKSLLISRGVVKPSLGMCKAHKLACDVAVLMPSIKAGKVEGCWIGT